MNNDFRKIAIIGNGFDMHHNLRTDYNTIKTKLERTQPDLTHEYKRIMNKLGVDSCTGYKWSNFEYNSYLAVEKLSDLDINDEHKHVQLLRKYHDIFKQIKIYILEILKEENKRLNVKFDSIQNVLDKKTYVINFNYTNTVEQYTRNIHYIHESITENFIVLGYDDWDDNAFDLTLPINRYWLKEYQRIFLSFYRF